MDAHELVCEIKRMASELGRAPTKAEFTQTIAGAHYKVTQFGGYTALLQAAGLPTYNERGSKKATRITNDIFRRDIVSHLEHYQPPEALPVPVATPYGRYPKILSISDIHYPFCNRALLQAFLERVAELQPEYVFLNGDAWDMYSYSKYPRSHNVFTPKEEQRLSREMNETFWSEIRQRAPKAKLIQMMGNHDIRPLKRVIEAAPEAEDWIAEKMKELFTFEGVETIFDARQEYLIGDIAIFHGYRSKLGDHRDYTLYNTINGHTHLGGAVFRKIRSNTLWELNSGVAGDPLSKGLTYTPQKISNWTPGWGEVDAYGPRFVPWRP